jgi:hypothetical protein
MLPQIELGIRSFDWKASPSDSAPGFCVNTVARAMLLGWETRSPFDPRTVGESRKAQSPCPTPFV